jgi:hypothetical protein
VYGGNPRGMQQVVSDPIVLGSMKKDIKIITTRKVGGKMDMVKKPLLAAPAPEEYIAVTSDSSRNWSGHLLCCFGKGDQNGFSSYAYAKFLPPLAWGCASRDAKESDGSWVCAANMEGGSIISTTASASSFTFL